LKFSAHLEINFNNDVLFKDRWLTAKQHGFEACEFVWRQHPLSEVQSLIDEAPLEVCCLGGTTGGNAGKGRPVLINPEDRERLSKDVEEAVAYAKQLSCKRLIFVPGNLVPGWSIERHRQEAVASLKYVAPILEGAGITVLIEPLNSEVNHPGTYCDNSSEAFRVVEGVGSPNVKMLYDVYHMQVAEGNLIQTIENNHDLIGYYHIAKVPGRYEPIGGEVNLSAVLNVIRSTGYDDFIGLEYKPSSDTESSYQALKKAYPESFKNA
jgi:hydroxypyruvate isomerase